MDEKIFATARKIFGERRFEELMGQLWLDRDRLVERARGRVSALPRVLREWEDRFRRDVEEGRFRRGRNKRARVMRFSELPEFADRKGTHVSMAPEDVIAPFITEKF